MALDNLSVLKSVQEIAFKQIEHNHYVDAQTTLIQENNKCEWDDLVAACLKYPDAFLVEVTPASDTLIKADHWIDSEESAQSSFLYQIGSSDAHLETHNVTLNLPVRKLIATKDWIVLSAVESFTEQDLEQLDKQSAHFTYLTGQEFLGRYSERGMEFNKLNPPSLYVEYIEDMYFNKYNWKSLHPTFRVLQLFNPGTIGFRMTSLTPHY